MNGKILSVKTKEKKTILVELTIELDGKRQKYTINEGTYRKIGCPLSSETVDDDSLEILAAEDEERRALAKALSLLGYADNNERQLGRKLLMHGFSRDAARAAVKECVSLGYINEERQMERLVVKYHEELFGPKKIMAKLASREYSTGQIIKIIRSLEERGEIDFEVSKKRLLKEKLPEDAGYDEKRKLLMRYGYTK